MKIIQTRLLLWSQAMTITPNVIIIRPEVANDAALLAHENVHCQQMRETGTVLWWFKYVFNRAFRLVSEVEAYRVQLALTPQRLDIVCDLLANRYFLGISFAQARMLLKDPV